MAEVLAAETVATVDLFTMGYWLTLLTFGVSAVGMFVGLACAVNGRRSVRFRPIWVAAAAVAIGGIGVWLASTVALLGISIPGRILRYDISKLTLSLVFAVAAVFLGLLLAGREFQLKRMVNAAAALGVGFGIMLWLQLTSVDIQGSVTVAPLLFVIAIVVAVTASSLCVFLFQRFRFPAARVGSIAMFGAGVAVFYFIGISSLEVPGRSRRGAGAGNGTVRLRLPDVRHRPVGTRRPDHRRFGGAGPPRRPGPVEQDRRKPGLRLLQR